MPLTTADVQSDLMERNRREILRLPDEIEEFSATHPVYIFNVGPWEHRVEHPSVGCVIIPACKDGEEYSKPCILPGLIKTGVPVSMTEFEERADSGRIFALDVLSIGPYKQKMNSLERMGVFIATGDTLNLEDLVFYRVGKGGMNVPRWVKEGKCPQTPSKKELAAAKKALETFDLELIHQADRHWDEGPTNPVAPNQGQSNITAMMREAARRRGQVRPWDQPLQSLMDCPGCGTKVAQNIRKHMLCGWRFDHGCFESDIDRTPKAVTDAVEQAKNAAKR